MAINLKKKWSALVPKIMQSSEETTASLSAPSDWDCQGQAFWILLTRSFVSKQLVIIGNNWQLRVHNEAVTNKWLLGTWKKIYIYIYIKMKNKVLFLQALTCCRPESELSSVKYCCVWQNSLKLGIAQPYMSLNTTTYSAVFFSLFGFQLLAFFFLFIF